MILVPYSPRVDFIPPKWLRNPHLQTIGTLRPRRFPLLPVHETRLIKVAPDSRVLIQCNWQLNRKSCPTIILLHGLEGSAQSSYMLGIAEKAWIKGFNAVRMNLRNCGGTEDLTPTLYNAGLSDDLALVVDDLTQKENLSEVHISGISMGGNIVLKLAGEWGSSPPSQVTCLSAISPSIDLGLAADAISKSSNLVYQLRFVRGLKARLRRKAHFYPEIYSTDDLKKVHSVREFDDRFTAPYCGYGNAVKYYNQASALRVIDQISLPTLILASEDDPFVPFETFLSTLISQNPFLSLISPCYGGHAGFISSRNKIEDCSWAENRVVEFAKFSSCLFRGIN